VLFALEASDIGSEEGLDFGEGVEPGEEGAAGLVVEKAAVELVAGGKGEPGELAGSSNCIQIHSSVFAYFGEWAQMLHWLYWLYWLFLLVGRVIAR
jgi:hypothetical protein